MHKLIYKMFNPEYEGPVDHINGNRRDNRIENLRACSVSENCRNSKVRKDSATGIKGVSPGKNPGSWTVRVRAFGKRLYIGYFRNLELAELVAIEARNKYHGEFARHQ